MVPLTDSFSDALARAVWPWVVEQRWAPQSAAGAIPAVVGAVNLTEQSTADDCELPSTAVWLLSVQAETLVLQVPIVGRRNRGGDGDDGVPALHSTIGSVPGWTLFDGANEADFWRSWIRNATMVDADRDHLLTAATKVKPLGAEQSNSSALLVGGTQANADPSGPDQSNQSDESEVGAASYVAKLFRVLHAGDHPEVELPKQLTEVGFAGVPALAAYWDVPLASAGQVACSGVVSEWVRDASDGFELFVDYASRGESAVGPARSLAHVVRQMHDHLREAVGEGSITLGDAHQRVSCSAANLRLATPHVDNSDSVDVLLQRVRKFADHTADDQESWLTQRVHGDLHLGQILSDGTAWYILDFEGEPLRPLSERTKPDSPLRDVAGMLRSFDYAWHAGGRKDDRWLADAREAFVDSYFRGDSKERLDAKKMLDALELEKAIYEVAYEATFRPEQLEIPLAAVDTLTHG